MASLRCAGSKETFPEDSTRQLWCRAYGARDHRFYARPEGRTLQRLAAGGEMPRGEGVTFQLLGPGYSAGATGPAWFRQYATQGRGGFFAIDIIDFLGGGIR
jgi:hypothetical protein